MFKITTIRPVDCVVGGFRYGTGKTVVGSLLVGLYDEGLLHHVGFTSSLPGASRADPTRKLEGLIEARGSRIARPVDSGSGVPSDPQNGSRYGRRSWWRFSPIISPATAFAMPQSFCGVVRTKIRTNA